MNSIIRRGAAVGLTVAACALVAGCDDLLPRSELGTLAAADFLRNAGGDGQARHHAVRPDDHPHLQEGSRVRNLEDEVERRVRAAQDLSDVPLVRTARAEETRRRHAGAGGLLHDRARADEPQFPLLFVVQRRLSERLRPGLRPQRRQRHGTRRLFVRGLFLDDGRAGRRHLRDRPRIVRRRPAGNPAAVLSVPHDGREPGQVPARSQHRLLEDLKNGSDHFEVAKAEPSVLVCGKRYVFGATAKDDVSATQPCPALTRDESVEALVAEKEQKDDAKVAELVASGVKPVRLVYADGGQNAVFAGYKDESDPDALATGRRRSSSPIPNRLRPRSGSPWPTRNAAPRAPRRLRSRLQRLSRLRRPRPTRRRSRSPRPQVSRPAAFSAA